VQRQQARQFRAQLVMVGTPVAVEAALDLGGVWQLALLVQAFAAEGVDRAQAGGVQARIQIRVFRRPVQVDGIARPARSQGRDAEAVGSLVQLGQVPVGVGRRQRAGRHGGGDFVGNVGAHVGHRQQHRRSTCLEPEIHHLSSSG
jgi:hypothetical protein